MKPDKVDRTRLAQLEDLPNIGKALADVFQLIGIRVPGDLVGKDPFELYETLCHATHKRQDPCVLDVFMSVTDFMAGGAPRSWWSFTAERKRRLARKKAD